MIGPDELHDLALQIAEFGQSVIDLLPKVVLQFVALQKKAIVTARSAVEKSNSRLTIGFGDSDERNSDLFKPSEQRSFGYELRLLIGPALEANTADEVLYLDHRPMVARDRTLDHQDSTADLLVLVIEDHAPIANEISRELKNEGLTVRLFRNKQDGLGAALNEDAALMILARPLAGEDSLDIIEAMRAHSIATPVLVISTFDAIDERIRGLRTGADDYLVKPFAVAELVARVDAIMRRVRQKRATRVRMGSLEIDPDNQLVWRNGRRIELFPREFKILEYFLQRPGEVITREDLLKDVWQYPSARVTNTVDVHLSSLRRKLDAGADQPTIVNIRRAGFMLRKH